MSLFATLFPLLCWFAYNNGVGFVERRYPSLSAIMSLQRRRWVANAALHETPYDAILAGNLMGSVSFLASTSALLVLANFATFGQLPNIMQTLGSIAFERPYALVEVQIHFGVLLTIFVLSFFAFTLSLRQFNHFCIMLGALGRHGEATEPEIDAIARLNAMAAKNFNNGLRAYYFAVAMVAWFASPWMAIAVSLATVGFIIHREFFSTAHRLAASVAISASRREASGQPIADDQL